MKSSCGPRGPPSPAGLVEAASPPPRHCQFGLGLCFELEAMLSEVLMVRKLAAAVRGLTVPKLGVLPAELLGLQSRL